MDIFREQKIHAANNGSGHRALCGSTGNALPKVTQSSHNVTCLRCLKILEKQKQGKRLIDIL